MTHIFYIFQLHICLYTILFMYSLICNVTCFQPLIPPVVSNYWHLSINEYMTLSLPVYLDVSLCFKLLIYQANFPSIFPCIHHIAYLSIFAPVCLSLYKLLFFLIDFCFLFIYLLSILPSINPSIHHYTIIPSNNQLNHDSVSIYASSSSSFFLSYIYLLYFLLSPHLPHPSCFFIYHPPSPCYLSHIFPSMHQSPTNDVEKLRKEKRVFDTDAIRSNPLHYLSQWKQMFWQSIHVQCFPPRNKKSRRRFQAFHHVYHQLSDRRF